jgi:hypothetical protein
MAGFPDIFNQSNTASKPSTEVDTAAGKPDHIWEPYPWEKKEMMVTITATEYNKLVERSARLRRIEDDSLKFWNDFDESLRQS